MTFANDKAKAQADAATLAADLVKANADAAVLAADVAALTPDPPVVVVPPPPPPTNQVSNLVVTPNARGQLLATWINPTSPVPASITIARDGTEADGVSAPDWSGVLTPAPTSAIFGNLADSKLYHITITPPNGVPLTVAATTQAAPIVTPPPAQTFTPDGAYTTPVLDINGVTWSIVNGQIAKNGVVNPVTNNVKTLYIKSGIVFFQNTSGQWFNPNPDGVSNSFPATDPTATLPTSTQPGGLAAPAPKSGYVRAFFDDFNTPVAQGKFPGWTAQLVGGNKWFSYGDYTDSPTLLNDTAKKGHWTPNAISIGQQMPGAMELNLGLINGVPQCASPCPAISFIHGRVGVRFYLPKPIPKYAGAWLLWADDNVWAEGEIDFPEGTLDGTIQGFDHDTTGTPQNNVLAIDTGVMWSSGWHTAEKEWTTSGVNFYLDGVLVGSKAGPGNGVPITSMHPTLQTETAYGAIPTAGGTVFIDWIYVDIPGTTTGGDPTPIATLAFSDAAGVFPSNLTAEIGGNGWGNGELETYTGRAVNAHCDGGGKLIVVARPENLTGPDGINRAFTSARLNTSKSLVLQPGTYVEVPVDYIPLDVLGAWPAVWTVGSDAPWPGGGEIDSPEGNNKHLWQTALHLASTGGNDQQYPWYDAIPMTDGPHVDGFYFDSERVQWYVDRILVRQVVATPAAAAKDSRKIFSGDQPASTSGRVWPFGTHPQYLIFNIAVNDPGFKGATMTIGGPVKAWKNNLPVKIIGG